MWLIEKRRREVSTIIVVLATCLSRFLILSRSDWTHLIWTHSALLQQWLPVYPCEPRQNQQKSVAMDS